METTRNAPAMLAMGAAAALFFAACTQTNQQTGGVRAAPIATAPQPVRVTADEYRVSGPFTHENLEVFLIHGDEQQSSDRTVLTLAEAMEQKKVKVHETGDVNELAIECVDPSIDVFVQSGDIVRGGKQDRVLASDLMLSAKAGRVPLASFCVEQGRWRQRNGRPNLMFLQFDTERTGQQSAVSTSSEFLSSMNCLNSNELSLAVKLANDQQTVWKKVAEAQARLKSNVGDGAIEASSATSLELTLSTDAVQKAQAAYTDELSKIVTDKKDVVGFAFAINGKIHNAEIYHSNDLFGRLWGKLLQATAVEAISLANAKKSPTPTGVDAIHAFLTIDATGKGHVLEGRMERLAVERDELVFTETRDKERGSAFIHRSYVAK